MVTGKKVLIPPNCIEEVNWDLSRTDVVLLRDTIKNSSHYDPSEPVNRKYYEEALYDYYSRKTYC